MRRAIMVGVLTLSSLQFVFACKDDKHGNAGAGGAGKAGGGGAAGSSGAAGGAGNLTWYSTCGAPVCGGPTGNGPTGAPLCTTQTEGDTCSNAGELCDPSGDCGQNLTCAASDPKHRVGGCPISRARYKSDIRYLDEQELRSVAEQLLRIPLAHWRYKHDPSARERLGFIIEDIEPSPSAEGDQVDLYGYTSMTVATLKVQAEHVNALERELQQLHKQVAKLQAACKR